MVKAYLLLAAAIALVALYMALTVVAPVLTTTPTPTATPPAATTPQHATPPATTPTATPPVTTTATSPITTSPTETVTTPPPTPRGVARFVAWIEAPEAVNVTALPALLNYTIRVKNVGNDTGVVRIGDVEYRLAPGQEAAAAGSLKISRAGVFEISVEISAGGVIARKEVRVYYLTPVFRAKAISLTVDRLPANVTVAIEVENVGNYTGRIAGVEVPPGGVAWVNKTIYVEAAGSYEIRLDNLSIPLVVTYLTPNLMWRVGGVTEIEALPGEKVWAWLWLKNVGNATARLQIDGRDLDLEPGREANVTKSLTVERAGSYVVEYQIRGSLNATIRHTTKVHVVTYTVEFVIWSPRLSRDWPRPGGTSRMTVEAEQKSVEVSWGYILSTNATRRAITLVVNIYGNVERYLIPPGAAVGKNFTTSIQAPGSTAVTIEVNNTRYTLEIKAWLKPPRITIADISRIDFDDRRPLRALRIKCGDIVFQFDLLQITGTLRYTAEGREVEGTAVLKRVDTYTASFTGFVGSAGGHFTLTIAGHQIRIETDASGNPTRLLIDGNPYNCDVDRSLIPRLLYGEKPLANNEEVTSYVYRLLASYLAKSDSDKPQSVVWNGEYVEIRDRGGNILKAYIRGGRIEIEGALNAVIYFS
ncbi:MAG: hypothetical protein ACK4SY_03690 [Pyrobaculum sp.]